MMKFYQTYASIINCNTKVAFLHFRASQPCRFKYQKREQMEYDVHALSSINYFLGYLSVIFSIFPLISALAD
jgi:hypothetical protein